MPPASRRVAYDHLVSDRRCRRRGRSLLRRNHPGCPRSPGRRSGVNLLRPRRQGRGRRAASCSTLALPADCDRGLARRASPTGSARRRRGVRLPAARRRHGRDAGGPPLIGVTAIGEVPRGRIVRRATARAGDRDLRHRHHRRRGARPAAAARSRCRLGRTLDDAARAHLADRYLHPQAAPGPRRRAPALRDRVDGRVGRAGRRPRQDAAPAPGATAEIDATAVPLSPAAAPRPSRPAGPVRRRRHRRRRLRDPVHRGARRFLRRVPRRGRGGRACRSRSSAPSRSGGGLPSFRDAEGAARVFAAGAFSHF